MYRIAACLLMLLIRQLSLSAQTQPDYRKPGAPIPAFILEKGKSTLLTNKILTPGKPVWLIIFSPQCEHCAERIDTLLRMQARLSGVQIVAASEARNQPFIGAFLKKKGMDTARIFRNTGVDRGRLINDIYNFALLPQFNIYNAKHRLVKTFSANFPMDSLWMYLPK